VQNLNKIKFLTSFLLAVVQIITTLIVSIIIVVTKHGEMQELKEVNLYFVFILKPAFLTFFGTTLSDVRKVFSRGLN
jgi:uncharacterized membrane protein YjfL (UPF0719 family)